MFKQEISKDEYIDIDSEMQQVLDLNQDQFNDYMVDRFGV